MMKDYYKKLYWRAGQEITPETFEHADNYNCVQQNLIRRLLNLQYYGLLPVNEASAPSLTVQATLNGSEISVEQLRCNGITKEGHLIAFDNYPLRNRLSFAALTARTCYVVLRVKSFEYNLIEPVENEETPLALPIYELDIKELTQIAGNELPVLKIENSGYNSRIDWSYIPPCMSFSSYQRLREQYRELKQLLTEILSAMAAKKAQFQPVIQPFTFLLFDLDQLLPNNPPYDLILILKKMVKTVTFFVKSVPPSITEMLNIPYIHDDISIILHSFMKCFQDMHLFIGKERVIEEDFTPRI